MSSSLLIRKAVVGCGLALALATPVFGQNAHAPQGNEYSVPGSLPGDQFHSQIALGASGGFMVWDDNITDGYGLGVSAIRLDSGFSPSLSSIRVNTTSQGDQNRPQVRMLNDGGAAFVWQAGRQGFQHINARFLSPSATWVTGEVVVNANNSCFQRDPVLATLTGGNVVVAYSSYNQAGPSSLQDIFAQVLTPTGEKVGSELQVNTFTSYNQRNPSVAALSDGRFAVVWVTEQQRVNQQVSYYSSDLPVVTGGGSLTNALVFGLASVDVYFRIFNANGTPATSEMLVNTSSGVCSTPHVAAANDGTFLVVWAETDRARGLNGIDIWCRTFTAQGMGGTSRCVNTTRRGDQYLPVVTSDGTDYLVAWTSLGKDGSLEGIFGQFLNVDGSASGAEFQINTTWVGSQIQPAVAANSQGRFLASWSSFVGGLNSFDLFAQRYVNTAQPLPPMDPPLVYVPFVLNNRVYQPQMLVSWPVQAGLTVDHYEVVVDGASASAVSLTTNFWMMTTSDGLAANSTHSFQVLYVTSNGRRSPLSDATSASAWGGLSYYGMPVEWVSMYWGDSFPLPDKALEPGGPTPYQVFLIGGDPLDPTTWLRTRITKSPQGAFLNWNSRPGLTYQVQTSSNLSSWANLGSPRLAAGSTDSMYVGGSGVGYFRVLRLR